MVQRLVIAVLLALAVVSVGVVQPVPIAYADGGGE